jgi:ABC-type multidrug transport system ATPase subunit
LLLDEPLVGLDTFALKQVVDVLDAKSQKGTLVIAAMHELDIVKSSFKRVIFIENKNSVIDGNPNEVLERLYRAEAVNK